MYPKYLGNKILLVPNAFCYMSFEHEIFMQGSTDYRLAFYGILNLSILNNFCDTFLPLSSNVHTKSVEWELLLLLRANWGWNKDNLSIKTKPEKTINRFTAEWYGLLIASSLILRRWKLTIPSHGLHFLYKVKSKEVRGTWLVQTHFGKGTKFSKLFEIRNYFLIIYIFSEKIMYQVYALKE